MPKPKVCLGFIPKLNSLLILNFAIGGYYFLTVQYQILQQFRTDFFFQILINLYNSLHRNFLIMYH